MERVGRQPAYRREIAAGRVDHDGRAAGIDLVARQIGGILQDGLMHESRAAPPVVLW